MAEVAWAIQANHGGGYQYRLCKKSEKPTEECFQVSARLQTKVCVAAGCVSNMCALCGAADAARVRRLHDHDPHGEPPVAARLRDPRDGHHHRHFPSRLSLASQPSKCSRCLCVFFRRSSEKAAAQIPACQGPGGSTNGRGGGNQTFFPNAGGAISCSPESYAGGTWQDPFYPKGPQFDPPGGYPGIAEKIPGLYTYGFGNNFDQPGANAGGGFLFSIVDKLQVPQDLPEGEVKATAWTTTFFWAASLTRWRCAAVCALVQV